MEVGTFGGRADVKSSEGRKRRGEKGSPEIERDPERKSLR